MEYEICVLQFFHMFYIFGLGNPGEEYENTRHNTGRLVLDAISKKYGFSEWKMDLKSKSIISKGEIGGESIVLVKPDTFMNNSGNSAMVFIDTPKKRERTVVIYDDIDLPIGTLKISYNRGDGGHNGLASVIKKLKSREFVRMRVGVAPTTPSGKIKKPTGEAAVIKFLMADFKESEEKEFKKIAKKIMEALETFVADGKDKMMSIHN